MNSQSAFQGTQGFRGTISIGFGQMYVNIEEIILYSYYLLYYNIAIKNSFYTHRGYTKGFRGRKSLGTAGIITTVEGIKL